MKRKALLIGAGFSTLAGLPLVWDLTKELYNLILRVDWKQHPKFKNNPIIPFAYELIQESNINYEDFISALSISQSRHENSNILQDIAGVKSKVIELVYLIIFRKQISGLTKFTSSKFVNGFRNFVYSSDPLWVFSLNHDNFIEYLCLNHDIPILNGFKGPEINLKVNGIKLSFDRITPDEVNKAKFDQFKVGQKGINLMKLHGGLEQFGIYDMKEYLSISVTKNSWDNFQKILNAINQIPSKHMAVTNEIIALDDNGEIQFMRRLHLAGSYKFDKRYPHNTPDCWIKRFGQDINYSNELIVIGYGFGDHHINSILENWLSHNSQRKMIIVAPDIKEIPRGFGQFFFQISLKNLTTEEYFSEF